MSDKITLTLTEDELLPLLEMVSLAMKVIQANSEEDEFGETESYEEVEQIIYKAAKNFGGDMNDVIHQEEETGDFFMDEGYEFLSYAQTCLDEFSENQFWQDLVLHMADSDLIQRIGDDAFEEMEEEERREQTVNIEKRLWAEFELNGVDHLHIIHPHDEG